MTLAREAEQTGTSLRALAGMSIWGVLTSGCTPRNSVRHSDHEDIRLLLGEGNAGRSAVRHDQQKNLYASGSDEMRSNSSATRRCYF